VDVPRTLLVTNDYPPRVGGIQRTLEAIEFWLNEHDYESLAQMQGSMNMSKVPVPAKLTRANYMKMLDSWQQ